MSGVSGDYGGFEASLDSLLHKIDNRQIRLDADDPLHIEALRQSSDPLDRMLAQALEGAGRAISLFEQGLPARTGKALIMETGIPGLEVKIENPYRGVFGLHGRMYFIDDRGSIQPNLPEGILEIAQVRQKKESPQELRFYPLLEGLTAKVKGKPPQALWYLGLYDSHTQIADKINLPGLSPIRANQYGEISVPPGYFQIFKSKAALRNDCGDSSGDSKVIIQGLGDHIGIFPIQTFRMFFNRDLLKDYGDKGH